MRLNYDADELAARLLTISRDEPVCILDSCGVGYLGSHLLIAGIEPVETHEASNDGPNDVLDRLEKVTTQGFASIFTLSYDLGRKLLNIEPGSESDWANNEPDLFLATFDVLIIHDYSSGITRLTGDRKKFEYIAEKLERTVSNLNFEISNRSNVSSDFPKKRYLAAVETIQERIRRGDTYQTNLTQHLTAELPVGLSPETVFARVRRDHPAPFAAFIKRADSTAVSASPERFFKVAGRTIFTSPIKGTRPRGRTPGEDIALRTGLLTSGKDRAENTMIVDLLRNDLGRVCEYGSVKVDKLCDLEEHPTFFHLVSTVTGELRTGTSLSDILRAVFPCGSITGAPKISTMKIIDEMEPSPRGLSMGAIGYHAPPSFGLSATFDLSVAIRTMVIRDRIGTFNVGGGITIDSEPEKEYEESLVKATALLNAINGTIQT